MELSELYKMLDGLDDEAKRFILNELSNDWHMPPTDRLTHTGLDDMSLLSPRFHKDDGTLDFEKVRQMMRTGQIAYPMMLKKAPIISIVRSPASFSIKSADTQLAEIVELNLQEVLAKRIDEILTMLEYGAFYGEVTYEPVYPQDYNLGRKRIPYWVVEDINPCHPESIKEILREGPTRAFAGFVQQGTKENMFQDIHVDRSRALIIANEGYFGNLAGRSVLEPVYVWWFWYELIWRSFLRFLQRNGMGITIVQAPSRGRVEAGGKSFDNLEYASQLAANLHKSNWAAIPSDVDRDSGKPLWSIDYKTTSQNEGRQFIEALELLGGNIIKYMLAAEAQSSKDIEFAIMLDTERILGHIATYLSEYLLPRIWYWNGSFTKKARIEFQGANSRVLPLLFKLMAVAGNTAGDALRHVDWRALFRKGGVPIIPEDELPEHETPTVDDKEETEEKAKLPPGGEGSQLRKDDEEGKIQELSLKQIYLSEDEVRRIEEAGARRSESVITISETTGVEEKVSGDV